MKYQPDINELSPELRHVAFEKGTEMPFSGKYVNEHGDGLYHCAVCGAPLFSSEAKFDSGTGWPSFDSPVYQDRLELKEDNEYGIKQTEVVCRNCGAHLGHVYNDGPTTTGQRYCINSVCLHLEKGEKKEGKE